MDGTERMVAWLLWKLCHLTFDRYSEVLRPFELALRDFVYNLLDNGLPLDWREKLAAYLDEWAAKGAEFGPQERYDLALYVKSRAVLEGRMPRDPNTFGAPTALEGEVERSRREIHEGIATAPTFPHDPWSLPSTPEAEWWKYPDQKAPIASIEERKGLGALYDEAVATGQHDPGFFERTAVSIVRGFFPDSAPTRVITRTDGTVEITLSAGPTSGALLQQALAIGGLSSAVAGGRVTKEVVETVVDTAVQEATGLPVGPSALRKPGSQVEGPESQHAPKKSPEASPHRQPDDPPDTEAEPTSLGHRDLEYWTKNVEFEGQKIYQRNDLIDPNLRDSKGRANLERMQAGLAPVTSDYDSISLHHLLQESGYPLAEVQEKFHREHRRVLHINTPSIPSGIERDAFDSFRRRYWRQRATDFGGPR